MKLLLLFLFFGSIKTFSQNIDTNYDGFYLGQKVFKAAANPGRMDPAVITEINFYDKIATIILYKENGVEKKVFLGELFDQKDEAGIAKYKEKHSSCEDFKVGMKYDIGEDGRIYHIIKLDCFKKEAKIMPCITKKHIKRYGKGIAPIRTVKFYLNKLFITNDILGVEVFDTKCLALDGRTLI